MKSILQTDYLLRFSYFTYSRGKYFLALTTAWQLLYWKDVSIGGKYIIFQIETLLICFRFKHFRRLTILFLVTYKFEQVFISRNFLS